MSFSDLLPKVADNPKSWVYFSAGTKRPNLALHLTAAAIREIRVQSLTSRRSR